MLLEGGLHILHHAKMWGLNRVCQMEVFESGHIHIGFFYLKANLLAPHFHNHRCCMSRTASALGTEELQSPHLKLFVEVQQLSLYVFSYIDTWLQIGRAHV